MGQKLGTIMRELTILYISVIMIAIMLGINAIFDVLEVPKKCRTCPEVGKLVVKYGAAVNFAELLEDMVIGDDMSEITAATLAREVSIPYEEALDFVRNNADKSRMTAANILNRNDAALPDLTTQASQLIVACEDGSVRKGSGEAAVFICTSSPRE